MSIDTFNHQEKIALHRDEVVKLTAVDSRSRIIEAQVELIGFVPFKGWPIVAVILDDNYECPVTETLTDEDGGEITVIDNQGKQIILSYSFDPANFTQLNIEVKPVDYHSEPLAYAEA